MTGASSGFGAAAVRRFALAGDRVVAAARRAERLEALAAELGGSVLPLVLDVRDQEAVRRAIASLPEACSPVEVLVNSAGLAKGLEPAQAALLEDWDEMIDTNCRGLVHCTRAVLPGMIAAGRGHVVNIGSVAGTYPYPGGNVYGATKAFVHQFSLALRSDLHGTGVRVSCIEPGMSETEFSKVRFRGDGERAAAVYEGMQPLSAEDVAEAVFFVTSLPEHVNVNVLELMPVAQSFAGFQVARAAAPAHLAAGGGRAAPAASAGGQPGPTAGQVPEPGERAAEPAGGLGPEPAASAGSVAIEVAPSALPFVTWAPPGHFYSPVPDLEEIERRAASLFDPAAELPGVSLRAEEQIATYRELASLARRSPLPVLGGGATRYGTDNPNYGPGDAMMLQSMLRLLRPRRYVEVGSGWSTALALDTNEAYLDGAMALTAIEPHPELLAEVLRPGDPVEVLSLPVQDVPMERWRALEAGDVLFVDSSHVLKTGSDVQHLVTRVLPALSPGVVVHVHDVFWPFEYLRHWVEEGRAWNEAYLLHAFLLFNDSWEIVLWNHWLASVHPEVVAAELPEMAENPGGAIWLRRRA